MLATSTRLLRWPGTRVLATLALALQVWFVVAVIAMHGLQSDLEVTQHRISEYALGPFGGLMTSAFAAAALGTLLLLMGLLRDGPMTWPARGARMFLKLAVLGLAVSAALPVSAPGNPASLPGRLHDIGLLLYVLSSVVTALLLTLSFSLDFRWYPVRGLSLLLALALAVETVVLLRSILAHEPWGIVNRVYALTAIGWNSCTTVRLWMVARS